MALDSSRVRPPGGLEPASEKPGSDVIDVRGLVKSYGRIEALRGLDLGVPRGEVYGFLGRNGAGKTTTIRAIMNITRPTAGTIRVFGLPVENDPISIRQRIGYVAQEQHFYEWMTSARIGRFVEAFYPTWDDAEYSRLLSVLDLPPKRKISTFSGGMKAKLALALALAHRPELLVLDEPTAGLDPIARREFLEMVREQAERTGRTTLFSSHILSEIERTADRVGIVDEGRMLYEGRLKGLTQKVRMLRRRGAPDDGSVQSGALPAPLRDPSSGFQILHDRLRRGDRELVVRAASEDKFETLRSMLGDWTVEPLSLEDVFVEMVSKSVAISDAE